MTFEITPRVRAHRGLRGLERYHHAESSEGDLPWQQENVQLRPDETVVGVYENCPGKPEDRLVITDQGIHICTDPPEYVKFDEIESYGSLDKHAHPIAIPIRLRSGSTLEVPVRGNDGRVYDSLRFWAFLRNVVQDVGRRSRGGVDTGRSEA